MKLNNLYFSIHDDDNTFSNISSDFRFQEFYFSRYLESIVKKEKFVSDNFNLLLIKPCLNPKKEILLKDKCLIIEIPFDFEKYKEIYPFINKYPIENLIIPIENKKIFGDFLYELALIAFEKATKLKANLPMDLLKNTLTNFKVNCYKNEWKFKSKTIKEYGLKINLYCKLTCNYFSLQISIDKDKKEIFRKEILKTLPHSSFYDWEFEDIKFENNKIVITKNKILNSNLFEINLLEIHTSASATEQ